MLGNEHGINARLPLLKSEHELLLRIVDGLILAQESNVFCLFVFLSICTLSIRNSSLLQANSIFPCLFFEPFCNFLYG